MLLWVVWIVLLVWAGLVKAEWFTKVSLIWLAIVGLGEVLFKASPETPWWEWGWADSTYLSAPAIYNALLSRKLSQACRSGSNKARQEKSWSTHISLGSTYIKYIDVSWRGVCMLSHVCSFCSPWDCSPQAPQAKTNCMTEPRFKICRCRPSFLSTGTAVESQCLGICT